MLNNILVHIPSERLIRPIADSAISLAVMCKAHLDAVSIGFETVHVGLPLDGGAALATVFEPTPHSRCLKQKPGTQVLPTAFDHLQAVRSKPQQASARWHGSTI